MTRKKRITLAAGFLTIFLCGGLGWATDGTPTPQTTPPAGGVSTATLPRPDTVLSERDFNFGTVQADQDISHDFMVQNKGQGELLIESVTPG